MAQEDNRDAQHPDLASKPRRPVQATVGSDSGAVAAASSDCAEASPADQPSSQSVRERVRQQQQWRREQRVASGVAGGEVVVAGRRYESLLELRHQMRVLQRQLLEEGQGEVEVAPGSPHFDTIDAVFRLHPLRARKAQDPIRRFFVCRNPHVVGGQGCEFQFEDARGVRDDFSLLKCTRPSTRPSRRVELLDACAHAVAGQVAEVAAAAAADPGQRGPSGGLLCSRCGLDFKVEPAYVGRSFSTLVRAYCEAEAPGCGPTQFDVDPSSRQATLRQQSEAEVKWAAGWVAFHRRRARLAMLCKCCQGRAVDVQRAQRLKAVVEARHKQGPA